DTQKALDNSEGIKQPNECLKRVTLMRIFRFEFYTSTEFDKEPQLWISVEISTEFVIIKKVSIILNNCVDATYGKCYYYKG
ncbi:hypothetical protein BU015_00515, partial [Staphylococcus simulans]|uniref:hypothetical protein n=1 Tax=Staphylococcus simulans TaxID=1286 RepID=UPI000EC13889